MQKHICTKIVGIINAVIFMLFQAGSIILLIANACFIFGATQVFSWFTPSLFSNNFTSYTNLLQQFGVPELVEYAFLILFGLILILSIINFLIGIKQIKISNMEFVSFHKKRHSLRFKNLCLLIFTGLVYFVYDCPISVVKYASWGFAGWILISFILISIDNIRTTKYYKKVVAELKEEEKQLEEQQRLQAINQQPVFNTDTLNPQIAKDKKLLAEINRLDKLQKDGVISRPRYVKMREQAIRDYGKTELK